MPEITVSSQGVPIIGADYLDLEVGARFPSDQEGGDEEQANGIGRPQLIRVWSKDGQLLT